MPVREYTIRDLIALLKSDGWFVAEQEDDSWIFKHPSKPGKIIIYGALDDQPGPRAVYNILSQAQLTEHL